MNEEIFDAFDYYNTCIYIYFLALLQIVKWIGKMKKEITTIIDSALRIAFTYPNESLFIYFSFQNRQRTKYFYLFDFKLNTLKLNIYMICMMIDETSFHCWFSSDSCLITVSIEEDNATISIG